MLHEWSSDNSLAVPDVQDIGKDVIQKTLNAIGVRYSHINDELLKPSRIEEERTKDTLRVRPNHSFSL